jgi:hypothetical protein
MTNRMSSKRKGEVMVTPEPSGGQRERDRAAPRTPPEQSVLSLARARLDRSSLISPVHFTWENVDLVAGQLVVRRTLWQSHEGPPKGGRNRKVPPSDEAVAALKAHRHLRGRYRSVRDDVLHPATFCRT